MSVPQRNITAQEADTLEHAPGREREGTAPHLQDLVGGAEVVLRRFAFRLDDRFFDQRRLQLGEGRGRVEAEEVDAPAVEDRQQQKKAPNRVQ